MSERRSPRASDPANGRPGNSPCACVVASRRGGPDAAGAATVVRIGRGFPRSPPDGPRRFSWCRDPDTPPTRSLCAMATQHTPEQQSPGGTCHWCIRLIAKPLRGARSAPPESVRRDCGTPMCPPRLPCSVFSQSRWRRQVQHRLPVYPSSSRCGPRSDQYARAHNHGPTDLKRDFGVPAGVGGVRPRVPGVAREVPRSAPGTTYRCPPQLSPGPPAQGRTGRLRMTMNAIREGSAGTSWASCV